MKYCTLLLLIVSATTAAGQWQLMPMPESYGLMQIWFTDPQHGYACGADGFIPGTNDGGIILETHDWGISWDTLFDPEGDSNYPAIIRGGDDILYSSNRYSNLYRSTDDGETWQKLEFEGTDFLYGALDMPNPETVLFAGYSGEIFKATDGGNTIERKLYLGTPYQSIFDMQCAGTDTCYCNTNTTILRTTDAGEIWDTVFISPTIWVEDFFVYPDQTLMCACNDLDEDMLLLRSVDQGVTWDTVSIIETDEYSAKDMAFQGAEGYILFNQYQVMHTADSGYHWTSFKLDSVPGLSGTLTDLQLLSATTGYIIGAEGLFYSMGVPTAIHSAPEVTLTLFPNPVQDVLHGAFQAHTPCSIYNVLGTLVHTAWPDDQNVDVHMLTPGMYVIVQDGRTGKFVKL